MRAKVKAIELRRQRGVSSLFITVILVLVAMLLAVTASVLSNTQFKLAGNIQFEHVAVSRSERAIATAESWLKTGTNAKNASFTTYSTDTPYLYPIGSLTADPLTMTWSDSNSLAVSGNDNRRYVIEKYGSDNQPLGTGLDDHGRPLTGCQKVDVFRISSRGLSAKGTVKFLQTTYSVPSC